MSTILDLNNIASDVETMKRKAKKVKDKRKEVFSEEELPVPVPTKTKERLPIFTVEQIFFPCISC